MESAFYQAIRDEPDDEAPRLAYADWLEEHGQAGRAEWIRASYALGRVHHDNTQFGPLLDRIREAFRRCRPPWWSEITGVTQRNDRGVFRFEARSRAAVSRLGKVPWLSAAVAEGWLAGIHVTLSDDTIARAVGAWKGPAREVPLFVTAAPQVTNAGLNVYLGLPQLRGLDLPANALRNSAVQGLGANVTLQELAVELRLVEPETATAVLDQVASMTALRRLTLEGHDRLEYGDRPNDRDLLRLRGLSGLRRLYLANCPAVTEEGIAELRRALPSLVSRR
jgi:uncharacterized protein (TIGR02996 family)